MAKICMLTALLFSPGGEQRVATVIANELAKNNRLVIYTMDDEKNRKTSAYQLDGRIEVRYTRQPEYGIINRCLRRLVRDVNEKTNLLFRKQSAYRLLEYGYFQKSWQRQLLQELTKEPYDVIVAVSGGNTIQLGLIADRLSCRTVGWEHNAYEAYFQIPGLYFWHQDQLFGRAVRNLDACVVLNENIRDKYREAFQKDCEVIYNPRSFASEEKSNLKNQSFVACGRMIRQKGFDLLIDSFRQFAEWEKEWKLTIVGDGDDRAKIDQMIMEYGLCDRVTVTGYTKDVKSYLKEASVYLLSSRWEGFPMVLTEAFEMGLPAVSYKIGAVEPLLTDGECGMLAEPFDTRQFAEKMLAMTKLSDAERSRMAKRVNEKADSLAVEKIIVKWKELLAAD